MFMNDLTEIVQVRLHIWTQINDELSLLHANMQQGANAQCAVRFDQKLEG